MSSELMGNKSILLSFLEILFFVKSQLVEAFSEQILAVLADDDSILSVARTAEADEEIVEQVKNGRSVCYLKFR